MLTKIKVYGCYTVKIYKNKPQFFFKPGGARPARRSWIRLCFCRNNVLAPKTVFDIAYFWKVYQKELSSLIKRMPI